MPRLLALQTLLALVALAAATSTSSPLIVFPNVTHDAENASWCTSDAWVPALPVTVSNVNLSSSPVPFFVNLEPLNTHTAVLYEICDECACC